MTTNTELIKDLIDIVAEEQIAEVELRDASRSIRILRRAEVSAGAAPPAAMNDKSTTAATQETAPVPARQDRSLHTVTAPMSGTFCRSAGADGEPIVKVGSSVDAGGLVCVIEAMKILNDVTTDRGGVIDEVLCEHGQAVEQGQALFVIRTNGNGDVR
ncbi:acetyl-CoA carboxylase biotin carboxyl carrier protein subunit [Variovorax defluvii]|uniref:Biotin carboxyl carrier protein of acetyl-CoA carboxylase n=1 Tax=Variovorax defluvii TaxID=913761 RepID=A0ABP8H5C1_9BURK